MNTANEILKKLIIHTADLFIQEHDMTQEDIILIDNFADALINELDTLMEMKNVK